MRRALLLAAVALAACAHPPRVVEHPSWPAPPQPARVTYLGGFPDERAVASSSSFWRRAFEIIVGIDEEARRAEEEAILSRPFGLAALGPMLYVADADGARVLAVKWAEGTFETITCKTAWKSPMAVAVTAQGVLFVADAGRARLVRIEKGECREFGEGLTRPTGLAVSGERLFVVDPPAHAVVSYGLEGGPALARFGTWGEGAGQLNFPTAIARRPDGALLVVDALNFRVVTYAPDGEVLSTFGQGGASPGDFGRPKAVTVDGRGQVYVSDAQYGVVLVFDPAGAWQLAFGGSGREPKNLSLPAGLAVSGTTLFVADAYHHRVELYELSEVTP